MSDECDCTIRRARFQTHFCRSAKVDSASCMLMEPVANRKACDARSSRHFRECKRRSRMDALRGRVGSDAVGTVGSARLLSGLALAEWKFRREANGHGCETRVVKAALRVAP